MARRKVIPTSNIVTFLLFLAPFVVFGYFVTRGINLPYVGYNAWNYNAYSHIAENYNLYGFLHTKLAPILSVSETLPARPIYYLHHPQLLQVTIAIFYTIFGTEFWVGRLPVILTAWGSLALLYLIGAMLQGRKYGLIALAIGALTPALPIFGRMIGQESFVLFLALSSLFLVLLYIKIKHKFLLLLLLFSVVLGTLSDWPMTYFTLSLSPFLLIKKQKNLAILLVATSTLTAVLFLIYTFFIVGSFSELIQAFFVRSTGELLQLSYWPFWWFGVIVLRILLYFNPLFVLLAVYYLMLTFSRLRKRSITPEAWLLLGLLFFGLIHILLYPEGSFGHAYWIYYLLPFFVFSTSIMLLPFFTRKYAPFVVSFFLFCGLFAIIIENWKTNEIRANLFRYRMASEISKYVAPYSALLLHPNKVIDIDLLLYRFHFQTEIVRLSEIGKYKGKEFIYVYSCLMRCDDNSELRTLRKDFKHIVISDPEAQAYLFFLNKKSDVVDLENQTNDNRSVSSMYRVNSSASKESILRYFYRNIKDFLHAPQI